MAFVFHPHVIEDQPPRFVDGPVVSGDPFPTEVLSAAFTLDPNSPADSFAYSWSIADDTAGFNALVVATTATYTVSLADVSKFVSVKVTASNSFGTTTGTSPYVAVTLDGTPIPQLPPLFLTGPTIVGNPVPGEALTVSYSLDPNRQPIYSVTFNWYLADDINGLNQTFIPFLFVLESQVGKFIGVQVALTNVYGTTVGTSAFIEIQPSIVPDPDPDPDPTPDSPVFTTPATITGETVVGRSLTLTYVVTGADTVTYQWYRADDAVGTNAAAISGGTGLQYSLTASDFGKYIAGRVTASATIGTVTATSSSTSVYVGDVVSQPVINAQYPSGYDTFVANFNARVDSMGQHAIANNTASESLAFVEREPWLGYRKAAEHFGDPIGTLESYAVATGNDIWRDGYGLTNNGYVPGYYNYTEGFSLDWVKNADASSRNMIDLLAGNASYTWPSNAISAPSSESRSRSCAYGAMSFMMADVFGTDGHNPKLPLFVQLMVGDVGEFVDGSAISPTTGTVTLGSGGHLEQWLGDYVTDANGNYVSGTHRFAEADGGFGPFMAHYTAYSLIKYNTLADAGSLNGGALTADARVLPKLIRIFDAAWNEYWIEADQALAYRWGSSVTQGNAGAPDLGMVIFPSFAWLYLQTGEERFRDRAEKIFNGGNASYGAANHANPWTAFKQWNDYIRHTFFGLDWYAQGIAAHGEAAFPEPAVEYIPPAYSLPTGTVHRPADSAELTSLLALGNIGTGILAAGHVIELDADVTYTGNFSFPVLDDSAWTYVVSSRVNSLSPSGTRVTSADTANLVAVNPPLPGGGNAIWFAIHCQHTASKYRFVGIKSVFPSGAGQNGTGLFNCGNSLATGGTGPSTLADLPTDIIIDRCWFQGRDVDGQIDNQGVWFDVVGGAILDSSILDITGDDVNDQIGIWSYRGGSNVLIQNNAVSAGAENLILGGTDALGTNDSNSTDWVIRGNHFFKQTKWFNDHPDYDGYNRVIKNLVEVKKGKRILIENNILEDVGKTSAGQRLSAFTLTPRNQSGGDPEAACHDIEIRYNIIRRVGTFIHFLTSESDSDNVERVYVHNNLLYDYNFYQPWQGSNYDPIHITGSASNEKMRYFKLIHNTMVVGPSGTVETFGPCVQWEGAVNITDFIEIRDNISEGTGLSERPSLYPGSTAGGDLSAVADNYTVTNNLFIDEHSSVQGTYVQPHYFTTQASVGFTNYAGLDFELTTGNHRAGQTEDASDGLALGANIPLVLALTANVDVTPSVTPVPDLPTAMTTTLPSHAADAATHTPTSMALLQNLVDGVDIGTGVIAIGDIVELDKDTTYGGHLVIPATLKGTSGNEIIFRSSGHASLPAATNRVVESDTAYTAKIEGVVGTDSTTKRALSIESSTDASGGAAYLRFIGIEFTTLAAAETNFANLIIVGSGSDTDADDQPDNIVFDRCLIHGNTLSDFGNAVRLDCSNGALIDSRVYEVHRTSEDGGCAVRSYSGSGPIKVHNNYLQASGVPVFLGDNTSLIAGTPTDVTVSNNHITKDPTWEGTWTFKNMVEIKNGLRLLFENNVMENGIQHAQSFSEVFYVNSETTSATEHVTIRFNKAFNHDAALSSESNNTGLKHLLVHDNLFYDINNVGQLIADATPIPEDWLIRNNTFVKSSGTGTSMFALKLSSGITNTRFRDNIFDVGGLYPFKADSVTQGTPSLNSWSSGDYELTYNLFRGITAAQLDTQYNAGAQTGSTAENNLRVGTSTDIGYVSISSNNYELAATSAFLTASSTGGILGADVATLETNITGVVITDNATLPTLTVDTTLPTGWDGAANATPADSAALTAALAAVDQTSGIYIIELTAGVNYDGRFTVPDGGGSDWLIIRSSAHASLPATGTRVVAADATNMPAIRASLGSAALKLDHGSHHIRFIGIEFTQTSADLSTGRIVESKPITTQADVQEYVTVDRCYIHGGNDTNECRGGLRIEANYYAVIDSRIEEIQSNNGDCQAVAWAQCDGPILIQNNYLSATSEIINSGGSIMNIADQIPSDITIKNNHLFKPDKWNKHHTSFDGNPDANGWICKNLLELKIGRRILIEGNVGENTWLGTDNQSQALVFTVRAQHANQEWAKISDLTVRYNKFTNLHSAMQMLVTDSLQTSQNMERVHVHDNLFVLDTANEKGSIAGVFGRTFIIGQELAAVSSVPTGYGIKVNHNTFYAISDREQFGLFSSQQKFTTDGIYLVDGFQFNDNIFFEGTTWKWRGSGLNSYNELRPEFLTNDTFDSTVIVQSSGGDWSADFPAEALWAASEAAVAFEDAPGGDYSLAAGSPYKSAATDGADIGCDIATLDTNISGVT